MYNQKNRKRLVSTEITCEDSRKEMPGTGPGKKMLRSIFLAEKSREPAFNIIVKCSEN